MAQVLPGAEARIGNTTDTTHSILDVISNPTLNVILPNSSFRHSLTLTSFELLIKDADGNVLHRFDRTTGNQLTKEQVDIIKGLSNRSQLLFTELIAGCPNCRHFKLPPYTITIR